MDGPGILPMDYDKKPVKIESAQAKEAKSDVRAEEVRRRITCNHNNNHIIIMRHHIII